MNKNLKRISILFVLLLTVFLLHNVVYADYIVDKVEGNFDQVSAYQVLSLVNQQRQANGKAPLVWDADLEAVAMQRAIEADGFFSHTRPSGKDCFTAIDEMLPNNNYYTNGENIFYAFGVANTPELAMNSWMNSQGHRENILSDYFTCIGVSKCGSTWVQVFGRASNTPNQTPSNFKGYKEYDVEIKGPVVESNISHYVPIKVGLGEEIRDLLNITLDGNSLIFYITSNDDEFKYDIYHYSINKNYMTVESLTPNILQIEGRKLIAKDSGMGRVAFKYQNLSYIVDFEVVAPDLSTYLCVPQYYADRYPDLKAAFGYDEAALRNHYETCGKAEGRQASPVFDPIWYLDKNPDLKATYGNDYVLAYNHFVASGISELRNSSSEYWGEYYRSHNSDLSSFSGTRLLMHYISSGRNEGRVANENVPAPAPAPAPTPTPSTPAPAPTPAPVGVVNAERFVFDYNFYADANTDLLNAFGHDEAALRNHWEAFGKREGRIASPVFSVKDYVEYNSDLKTVYGTNYAEAINHFIAYGASEGRKTARWFDVRYYIENNSDLKAAFGNDYGRAFEHFVNNGITEPRKTADSFNVEVYRSLYPDLNSAFQADFRGYFTHYIRIGISEGRKGI